MSLPFVNGAAWIWSAEGTHAVPPPGGATPSHYQVRRFRRTFDLTAAQAASASGTKLVVHVSADSRYLFFCNGRLIGRGPAKGDVNHHFYETFDLSGDLRPGTNVLAALVLDMSRVAHRPALLGAPCSVMTYAGGFVLEGAVTASDGTVLIDLTTGTTGASEKTTDNVWRVAVDTACRFQNEATTFEGYHGYFEHRVSKYEPRGWTLPEFDDREWQPATTLFKAERYENRRDPTSPYGLLPRLIPALEENVWHEFSDTFAPGGLAVPREDDAVLAVPANATREIIFDVGELTTGYPVLEIAGGSGATVRLIYAEALRLPWETPGARLLGRRQSLANLASHFADESTGWTFDRRGTISGWRDIWEPAGEGTKTAPEVFEPLHWRTFRYVSLRIETGTTPLEVRRFRYRFTAYPYQVQAKFACSDARLEKIWDAALRTMRLCSHETFEDCPYYEQMQYAGDTMITSKIAMLATGDYALSRQAILHFDWSRISDGLTQSRYPSRLVQIIPSWSLHWITNVRDYVYCSGDLATACEVMHGMRAVLAWFERYTDTDGLPAKLPFWNITDWCPWWPRGVVPGADSGPTCIIAAQYILALDEFADLCRLLERKDEANELQCRADRLRKILHARFWSEAEGLYFDRPGGPEISQYGNAWAIVCGAAGDSQRRRILTRFPNDPKLAPGSFFWWHAGFRALEVAGAYDRMTENLGIWHEMIDGGLSTFVEENSYWRSLCHAWSAHPALEFMTRVLGVTPRTPGFAEIDITPQRCGLTHARGQVCTPRGNVSVAWRIENGSFAIEVTAPERTPVRVRLPDGTLREFAGGAFSTKVPV